MPKPSSCFVCQSCGSVHSKWAGRCDSCGEWNTLVEEITSQNERPAHKRKKGRSVDFVDLGGESQAVPRLKTGIDELDRVTGGGLVPGSALLVGGDPGIGKSTLLLQATGKLAAAGFKTAYISGEESTGQVRRRAKRLGVSQTPVSLRMSSLSTLFKPFGQISSAQPPEQSPKLGLAPKNSLVLLKNAEPVLF